MEALKASEEAFSALRHMDVCLSGLQALVLSEDPDSKG
jgi:hypothetical protein